MARRGNRRKNTIGPIIGIASLVALIALSFVFVLNGNRAGYIAGIATDISATFGRVISAPVRWTASGWSSFTSFFGGSAQIKALRAENAQLREWRNQAAALTEKLQSYEKLHGIAGEQLSRGLTGRMIGETQGVFARSGIVNLGKRDGVEVNWIVLNQNGLVGRVIAVGNTASRVLMLGDPDSRVPVMGAITRARALASGDKTLAPRLAHLNTPALMQDGELVMTSGDDGIFPRGIIVGQAGIAPDKLWHVRLASNASPVDFVSLIPPSNFPPPIDPVTPPSLAAPPIGASAGVSVIGAVLPLAPGAAPIPTAATPEAIRAAQTELARKAAAQTEANQALTKKLIAERDAAREAARKAEAARVAAERLAAAQSAKKREPKANGQSARNTPKSEPKQDPSNVPIAPSALQPSQPEPKAVPTPVPVPVPASEGPTK